MSKIIKVFSGEEQKQIKGGHFKPCPICGEKIIPVGVKSCKACKPKGKPSIPKPKVNKIQVSEKHHGVWSEIP